MNSRCYPLVAGIVSVALALGCILQPRPADAADKLRVGTSLGTAFTYIPLSLGLDQGIFQKAGIDVERIDFGGGSQLEAALLAGSVDVALGAGTDLRFAEKGAPQTALAAIVTSPANIGITVAYGSPLKTFNDLKDRTVGVSSTSSLTDWLVLQLNSAKGWGSDGAKPVAIGGSPSVNVAAIKAHTVDATAGDIGVAFQAEDNKDMQLIGTFSSVVGEFVRECIFASNKIIQEKPDVMRRFVKAWLDSVAFMKTHKAEAVAVGSKIQGVSPSVESRVYDLAVSMFSDDGRFHAQALEVVRHSFVETGLMAKEPDFTHAYTEAFLPKEKS